MICLFKIGCWFLLERLKQRCKRRQMWHIFHHQLNLVIICSLKRFHDTMTSFVQVLKYFKYHWYIVFVSEHDEILAKIYLAKCYYLTKQFILDMDSSIYPWAFWKGKASRGSGWRETDMAGACQHIHSSAKPCFCISAESETGTAIEG